MSNIQVSEKIIKPRKEGWVYILWHPNAPERIKIGFSRTDPEQSGGRVRHLTFLLRAFRLGDVEVFSCQHNSAAQIEQNMKKALKKYKVSSEGKGDSTEIFIFNFEVGKRLLGRAVDSYGNSDKWSAWLESVGNMTAHD